MTGSTPTPPASRTARSLSNCRTPTRPPALYKFLAAVRFLTVLPVPAGSYETAEEDTARSLPYFPLVGALMGAVLALLNWLLAGWLPGPLGPLLLVIALLALTGALHFDGFLDSCDGLFGYRPPARRLEIMRD